MRQQSSSVSPKRRRVRSLDEGNTGSDLLLQAIAFVSKVPLFSQLEPTELPRLAAALISQSYKEGDEICQQGAHGGEMFIIQSGKAVVYAGGEGSEDRHPIDELGPGDPFGIRALLRGAGYLGTLVAAEDLKLWVLEHREFERMGLRHKLHYSQQKKAEVHERVDKSDDANLEEETPSEMSDEIRRLLRSAMMKNATLGPHLDHLSEDEAMALAGRARRLPPIAAGTEVFQQGDKEGELFYMVQEGSFDCIVNGRKIRDLGPGGSFGEEALLFWEPRKVTVRATTDAVVWVLHRKRLRRLTLDRMEKKLEEYSALLASLVRKRPYLMQVPGLEVLAEDTNSTDNQHKQGEILRKLASALTNMTFFKGEYVCKENEESPCLFIVSQGEVTVEGSGRRSRHAVTNMSEGKVEVFGERSLQGEPQAVSVCVASETAEVLALDQASFLQVIQPSEMDGTENHSGGTAGTVERPPVPSDLDEIGVLGWGSYAQVTLQRHKTTNVMYALKSLSKGRVMQKSQVAQVRAERLVLKTANSPFIVKLFSTFRTDEHVSFLLEPCMGGDLFTVCERMEIFHSNVHARFFVACAVQGLDHLHKHLVIYRDLKLENMLLDKGGCCKLADFGLAKFVVGHTFTLCGTPDYMAPEIISGVGHTRAVDWWALGAVIYALMTGSLPFDAAIPQQTFLKVKRGIEPVLRITGFQGNWGDLVERLMRQDPSARLAVRRGPGQVRRHPWFADARFDWKALNEGTMTPPYVPVVRGKEDLSNFDPNPEDAPPEVPYYDPGDGWDDEFDESHQRDDS